MKNLTIVLCLLLSSLLVGSAIAGEVEFKPYGFVRGEGYYDTESVAAGDWLLFSADDQTPGRDVGQLSFSARHTRIGVKISGIEYVDGVNVYGKIETDFAGGFPNSTTQARQPLLRLRLAYVAITTDKLEYRIGQDWTIISAPFPNTAMFVVGAGLGNLWMRMPQMSLAYKMGDVKLTGSVNRAISATDKYDAFTSSDLDVNGSGEKTGLPYVMGRLDWNKKAIGISVMGHTGWEDIPDGNGKIHRMNSWSGIVALRLESGKIRLRGEYFQGENLNAFFGGIIQGQVAMANKVENIAAMGGWVDLTYKLTDKWSVVAGAGMDDPDDEFLGPTNRDLNEWIWGNFQYKPVKNLTMILETNYVRTTYVNEGAGDNVRIAFVTVMTF
ncbi:hypothetical protein KQI52_13480 [bacterium]|nr:hypothetical protein [bacterium]